MTSEEIERELILDKETAIKQLGDEDLFMTLLTGFEDMTLRKNLIDLKISLENIDYYNIRQNAHALKGASAYLYAQRVKSATSHIETAVENRQVGEIFKYYPILIKQCIILKQKIRYEICLKESMYHNLTFLGKPFSEDESDFDVPIAKFYKLIKRSANDFDIKQIMKTGDLPPIPAYNFKKSKKDNEPAQASEPEVKMMHEETKDMLSSAPKEGDLPLGFEGEVKTKIIIENERADRVKPAKEDKKVVVEEDRKNPAAEIKKVEDGKGHINISEEAKTTGCSCTIL